MGSGWGTRSQWVKNILANPHVTIQTAAGTQSALARRVTDEATNNRLYEHAQRSPIWEEYLDSWGIAPIREDYVAKQDRLLNIAFDPTDEPTPPPLKADLAWLWGVLAAIVLLGRRGRAGSGG